jgi:hypothetical protein
MNARNFLKAAASKALTAVLFVALLAGCGPSSSGSANNQTPATSTASPVGIGNSNIPNTNTEQPVDFPLAGLLHIHFDGFSCPPSFAPNTLILATDQKNYDVGTIQQMANYIDALLPSSNGTTGSLPPLPAELSLVSGAQANLRCSGSLQITNIGNTTIQVSQINMKLAGVPRLNSYHYRSIDICSMPIKLVRSGVCGPPSGTGASQPLEYDFQFKMGEVSQGQSASSFSIDPGQIATAFLTFVSSGTPGNFIYSVVPEITLNTQDVQSTFMLTQLSTTFAFADTNQFQCYTLQGDQFVPLGQVSNYLPWCY